jgi:outer membrane PBP1 activator LpoA protein
MQMLPHVINRQFIHLGLKFFLTLSLAFLCCHQDKIEFGSIESDIENRKYAQAESKLIKQLIQDSIKGDSHSIAASQILYSKLKFAQFKYDEALEHINKSLDISLPKSSHTHLLNH